MLIKRFYEMHGATMKIHINEFWTYLYVTEDNVKQNWALCRFRDIAVHETAFDLIYAQLSVRYLLCLLCIWFNLCAALCTLSFVSAIMTWSSADNSVDSCWFFESLIPVMSWFCHLVIISSKYIFTLWPLTTHIGVVPHRQPVKLHFIYLFNKYRYWKF